MENEDMAEFNYIPSSVYVVYNDGMLVGQTNNFKDIKNYSYEEK